MYVPTQDDKKSEFNKSDLKLLFSESIVSTYVILQCVPYNYYMLIEFF
jgi:hypothetical protein